MRGGDLSNEIAPGIGIRFERIIKTEEGRLNKKAKGFLEDLASVEYNVYIITTGDRRKCLQFLTKWRIPYSDVFAAETDYEVADIVREHDMLTYWDIDREMLNSVNSRGPGNIKVEQWTLVSDISQD